MSYVLSGFVGGKVVPAGSAITLNKSNASDMILLDTAGGSTVTLPTSIGDNSVYRFIVSTLATTLNHIIKVGNTVDNIQGMVNMINTGTSSTVTGWASSGTLDTITLNRTTTGSVTVGEYLEIRDLSAGVFVVSGQLTTTASSTSPFSATV